jgi:hypothetical protein
VVTVQWLRQRSSWSGASGAYCKLLAPRFRPLFSRGGSFQPKRGTSGLASPSNVLRQVLASSKLAYAATAETAQQGQSHVPPAGMLTSLPEGSDPPTSVRISRHQRERIEPELSAAVRSTIGVAPDFAVIVT